jgi:hypothetical protein
MNIHKQLKDHVNNSIISHGSMNITYELVLKQMMYMTSNHLS